MSTVLVISLGYIGLNGRKPVFGGLRTTKAQTSLSIRIWRLWHGNFKFSLLRLRGILGLSVETLRTTPLGLLLSRGQITKTLKEMRSLVFTFLFTRSKDFRLKGHLFASCQRYSVASLRKTMYPLLSTGSIQGDNEMSWHYTESVEWEVKHEKQPFLERFYFLHQRKSKKPTRFFCLLQYFLLKIA